MDEDNSLNIRNWGYYEPTSVKGNLGLQLLSPTMPEKPFLGARSNAIMTNVNGGFHHRDIGVSQPMFPMEYMRDVWIGHREKLLNMLPGNHNYEAPLPETASTHHVQVFQPPDSENDEMVDQVEESGFVEKENGPNKKRQRANAPKSPKAKKGTRAPRVPKPEGSPSVQRVRSAKKTAEIMINGINMDMSVIPIPVCSCTGNPQQCYRWGCGGWQSACCTTCISMYPLPMSTKRRGARIAGRKMSSGAFKKVLEKLADEGYDFSNPIDLRTHWAKHGTNKFVTIRLCIAFGENDRHGYELLSGMMDLDVGVTEHLIPRWYAQRGPPRRRSRLFTCIKSCVKLKRQGLGAFPTQSEGFPCPFILTSKSCSGSMPCSWQ